MSIWILRDSGRERIGPARHTIVEPCANAQHDIAVVHAHVGFQRPVHADHADEVPVGRRQGAQPHESERGGDTGHVDEIGQQLRRRGAGIDDAASGIDQGLPGARQQIDSFGNPFVVTLEAGTVAWMLNRRRWPRIGGGGRHHVLGQVHHNRTGPTTGGNQERLPDDTREIIDILHEVVVLGTGPRDAEGIGPWKASLPIRCVGTWPVRQTTGTESIKASARPVTQFVAPGPESPGRRRPCRSSGHIPRQHAPPRLLAHQDVPQAVLLAQRIIDRQHGATRITEDDVHTKILEDLDENSLNLSSACRSRVHLSATGANGADMSLDGSPRARPAPRRKCRNLCGRPSAVNGNRPRPGPGSLGRLRARTVQTTSPTTLAPLPFPHSRERRRRPCRVRGSTTPRRHPLP